MAADKIKGDLKVMKKLSRYFQIVSLAITALAFFVSVALATLSPPARSHHLIFGGSSSETKFSSTYDGITQGVTEGGFPFLGNPNAPVTIIDYSDFL